MSSVLPTKNLSAGMNAAASPERAWFCLCARPKHEHIVAAHLRQMEEIEVFLPRIRFKRETRQGLAWVTEALFPGYLFVRFDWKTSVRRVQTISGARGIVHFGNQWPVIPDATMEELREAIGPVDLHTISQEFVAGDAVRIADGTLRGLRAVISHVLPGRERVAVLMELLGRQTTVELEISSMIKEGDKRTDLLS
jgi:transcriptional antiterminator RfaH